MNRRSQITSTVTLAVILTSISGILGNAVPLPAFVKDNIWLLLAFLALCLLALIFLQVREQLAQPGKAPPVPAPALPEVSTPDMTSASPEATMPAVQPHQPVSSAHFFSRDPRFFSWQQEQKRRRIWQALSEGLNGKDVLTRVRKRSVPSNWRVIPLFSLADFVWPMFVSGCGWGLIGLVGSSMLIGLAIGAGNSFLSIHNFLLQIGAAGDTPPDWLVSASLLIGAIGAVFGGVVAWVFQERPVLALLPDGFVYGDTTFQWGLMLSILGMLPHLK
ncbi:hypothetical protein EPA93_27630 [Ktedonosporobacter rubrisoli]|uniref:Uncharacterized protein n=1 Tax=Ktedonosporobacter rubrisoli TaxID=2509675 RepID=A0A4P6JVS3_KTERU|nr:hypothetical protein [Ktedonosporobacter rubrisoli]QBD79545.1 hypothetical protein EPA93_27630 [Ktedonosporobacter rubrisoli]